MVAPLGPVYQAGTLSGNPLAMAAGIVTLQALQDPSRLREPRGERDLPRRRPPPRRRRSRSARPHQPRRLAPDDVLHDTNVTDFATAKQSDTDRYAAYFREMLARGIFLAPSQFEAMFVSAAHTDDDINATIQAARESLASVS